jgi:hypothetical protein
MIDDYEFSRRGINPDWLIVPELIPKQTLCINDSRLLRYPGIKEDVYVSGFQPSSNVGNALGLDSPDLVVTVRPPASEAHYHNPESDLLYRALIDYLITKPRLRMVILPRSAKQALYARETWKDSFDTGKIIIPNGAIDGLSLIWFSDLVISGGGTMNREAAALGVPVYSIFRGPMGAVDRYLAAKGKLVLIETTEDISRKILLERRLRSTTRIASDSCALRTIVNHVIKLTELCGGAPQQESPVHSGA